MPCTCQSTAGQQQVSNIYIYLHLLTIYYYYHYVFRPTPTIHWRKDGEDALKYRAVTESFGKILKIKEATKADQGTYHCDAENQMGSTHRSFHVHVEGTSFQRVFSPIVQKEFEIT